MIESMVQPEITKLAVFSLNIFRAVPLKLRPYGAIKICLLLSPRKFSRGIM